MTQKEIDKFLASTKVYVAGKSREIQKKLFSFGYEWCNGHTVVDCTEDPFLFIYESKLFTKSSNMDTFSNHENREISAEEILSLELTKPKFDPKTLQPYNNILVRNDSSRKWCCSIFSHIDYELTYHNISINGLSWKFCIPYNEETIHLLGTTEEAPEYYKYWKD